MRHEPPHGRCLRGDRGRDRLAVPPPGAELRPRRRDRRRRRAASPRCGRSRCSRRSPYTTDMRYSPIGECAREARAATSGSALRRLPVPPNLFDVARRGSRTVGRVRPDRRSRSWSARSRSRARSTLRRCLTITAVAGLAVPLLDRHRAPRSGTCACCRSGTSGSSCSWALRWPSSFGARHGSRRELAVRRREAVDRELMRTAGVRGRARRRGPDRRRRTPPRPCTATDGAPTVPSPTERYDPRTDPTVQPWAPSPRAVVVVVSAVLTIILVVGVLVQIDHDKGFLPYWVEVELHRLREREGRAPTPTARSVHALEGVPRVQAPS